MLGCSCSDDAGSPPMRIRCALALYEGATYGETVSIESDLTFDVVFQKRSTAKYLTCKEAEISVQSVRCVHSTATDDDRKYAKGPIRTWKSVCPHPFTKRKHIPAEYRLAMQPRKFL